MVCDVVHLASGTGPTGNPRPLRAHVRRVWIAFNCNRTHAREPDHPRTGSSPERLSAVLRGMAPESRPGQVRASLLAPQRIARCRFMMLAHEVIDIMAAQSNILQGSLV
jgi:hypothetical protein